MEKITPRWKWYLAELRAPFFTASIVPILLGTAIAWARTSQFNLGYFLLTLLGGILLHAGTNVANDYFDWKSGNDIVNVEFVRPYTGGSRLIQKGLLSPSEVLAESLICFTLGSLIGLYLTYKLGIAILWLGAIGVFSGFFYCAPPFYLVYRGLGELVVGLNFGVLMTLGAYYTQTQLFSLEAFIASLPVALLITAVLYINEFQDARADAAVGKNHWVVRLGKAKAVWGYAGIIFFTYFIILAGILSGILSPWTGLAFVTFPIAYGAVKTSRAFYDNYLKLTPANVATIMTHLLVGLLMTIGYILNRLT